MLVHHHHPMGEEDGICNCPTSLVYTYNVTKLMAYETFMKCYSELKISAMTQGCAHSGQPQPPL